MSNNFYITAAIPYVNGKPHLGHVLEWFQADSIAQYQRMIGNTVTFSCGTDENSLKNVQAAEKANISSQDWLDQYAQIFEDAFEELGISLTNFRRGSDQVHHWPGVQELWKRCEAAGDIYTKEYTGLYCVGCEMYYTEAELVDGLCPEHLKKPESITETNYFFRLSKYEQQIKTLIESNQLSIVSDQFRQEMLGFVKQGLEDFSVSRSQERSRGIGVPVPNDPSQVMYVWFDALAIYLTSIGWGYDAQSFDKAWPADVHVIGKGIARFHAVYWIGMLLSAGLSLPKAISIHGYITSDGQKMSKSLGNVVEPFSLIQQYGLEPVRYYLLKHIPTHSDGDFSEKMYQEVYTADLANGIGNLCSRTATLAVKTNATAPIDSPDKCNPAFAKSMNAFKISDALLWIIDQVKTTDHYLSEKQPWKNPDAPEAAQVVTEVTHKVVAIGYHLQPFMPQTAAKILNHFTKQPITAMTEPLFPRLS
ncbi:MAG: methionine--tRNA ligase [Patescibacteria group bacterium]